MDITIQLIKFYNDDDSESFFNLLSSYNIISFNIIRLLISQNKPYINRYIYDLYLCKFDFKQPCETSDNYFHYLIESHYNDIFKQLINLYILKDPDIVNIPGLVDKCLYCCNKDILQFLISKNTHFDKKFYGSSVKFTDYFQYRNNKDFFDLFNYMIIDLKLRISENESYYEYIIKECLRHELYELLKLYVKTGITKDYIINICENNPNYNHYNHYNHQNEDFINFFEYLHLVDSNSKNANKR